MNVADDSTRTQHHLGPDIGYAPASTADDVFYWRHDSQSSIMRIFPRWAEYLELGDVVLQGINFRQHDDPQHYRQAVEFIKHDPLSVRRLGHDAQTGFAASLSRSIRRVGRIRDTNARGELHFRSRTVACSGGRSIRLPAACALEAIWVSIIGDGPG